MTVETQQQPVSKLDAAHRHLGAKMTERDGHLVPQSYGDVQREYAAVRNGGAGVIDLSSRGRLLVTGSEAIQFLNGLITNDMKTLAQGTWMSAAFPNVQGRLVASVRVARLEDDQSPVFLIDTEAATHERVVNTLQRFTLAGDFHISDLTETTAQLTIQGEKSSSIVAAVISEEAAGLETNGILRTKWTGGDTADPPENLGPLTVMRATHTAEDGFDLFVDANAASALWQELIDGGAEPVGYDALEILRIEAGVARYGVDMDETNVVTESNLDDAVSYTKGCYIGQEIIARIKYRGHVAKKLTGLTFVGAADVSAGDLVRSADGKDIGRLTSAIFSPSLERTIALAYLKFDFLAPDTNVRVASGTLERNARVTELPFIQGSKPRTPVD